MSEAAEIEYTEIEVKAMDEGWIPPDRFDDAGKNGDFKSAEKYMENSSFFRKIKDQKKEIQELRSTVSGITEHQQKVAQRDLENQKRDYEERISTLESQKVQALDEGDHSEVVKIDRQINETEKPKEEIVDTSPFDNWVADNAWYTEDKFLAREATAIGEQIARDEGLRGKELFNEVSSYIKEKYPDKFNNKRRDEAPSVEGGSNLPPSGGKIASEKNLTADERTVYNKFDRNGMFKDDSDGAKRKSYLKQVLEMRD